jgi:hypothetical protein
MFASQHSKAGPEIHLSTFAKRCGYTVAPKERGAAHFCKMKGVVACDPFSVQGFPLSDVRIVIPILLYLFDESL